MMKKIYWIVAIVLVLGLSMTGCQSEEKTIEIKERAVGVKVAEERAVIESLYYFGFVEPTEVKTYALKTSGTLETVNIQVGDGVEIGELLVSLDDYQYGLGKKASSQQVTLALLEVDKVRDALVFYEKAYTDTLTLFNEGAIAKQKLDEIKLQYDTKMKELEQAQRNVSSARIDYDVKSIDVDDTSLISDMEGYVVDVLTKEGELVSKGYPVVIVRSKTNVVKVGLSQKDIKRVAIDDAVRIVVGSEEYTGRINKIDLMPDKMSRTYSAEISMSEGDFLIGESCKVYIDLDQIKGIWMNITEVMNDGVDYVYIVENGRATRRDIELHEINKDLVRVTNINAGDHIIISGKNSLAEGYKVIVEGDDNE